MYYGPGTGDEEELVTVLTKRIVYQVRLSTEEMLRCVGGGNGEGVWVFVERVRVKGFEVLWSYRAGT